MAQFNNHKVHAKTVPMSMRGPGMSAQLSWPAVHGQVRLPRAGTELAEKMFRMSSELGKSKRPAVSRNPLCIL